MGRTRVALLLVACITLSAGCSWLDDRLRPPGSAAHDLVSAKAYPNLLLEVDYPSGSEPNADALDVLRSTLQDVTGRDAAHVRIVQDASIPSEPDKKYTQSEIQALESAHRSHHTAGDTVVLYVVYVAGGDSGDSANAQTLGYVYRETSIAMFKGNIKANSANGPLSTNPPERAIEQAVLVHEMGHAMGLVNLGAPMQSPHEDAQHPHHSTNQQSVMYWAVENSQGLAFLCNLGIGGQGCGIPFQYDSNDKADLRALREK